MVYYHRVGTSQDKDVLIFDDTKDPLNIFVAKLSCDGKFLLISSGMSRRANGLLAADLTKVGEIKSRIEFKSIASEMDAKYSVFEVFVLNKLF